jgi:hypothetical protein
MTNLKIRLCQQVALSHKPGPVLDSAQIALRLGRSPKTIRNWLRSQSHSPNAFKTNNEWYVYQSELLRWEEAQCSTG